MESQGGDCTEEVQINTPRELQSYCFKVIVVGEPGVGKSAFIKRYIHDTFSFERRPTISLDFQQYTFRWDHNTEITMHFWDVPGQQRIEDQMKLFFRNTWVALVLYDVTKPATMTKARLWKKAIMKHATLRDVQRAPPCILLGNKIDLVCEKSEDFERSALDQVVKEEGFHCGFPISNYGNYNIAQVMRKVGELGLEIVEKLKTESMAENANEDDQDDQFIDLSNAFTESHKKCEC